MKFEQLEIGDHFMLQESSKTPIIFKKVSYKHYITLRNGQFSIKHEPFQIDSDVFPCGILNKKDPVR